MYDILKAIAFISLLIKEIEKENATDALYWHSVCCCCCCCWDDKRCSLVIWKE